VSSGLDVSLNSDASMLDEICKMEPVINPTRIADPRNMMRVSNLASTLKGRSRAENKELPRCSSGARVVSRIANSKLKMKVIGKER